jgi:NAD(P)-dependent dehydrogenase (short-subunit alcohol dehydrogenase family)
LNKTVLITGANGGIGLSLCRVFKESGWIVIGTDNQGNSNKYCELFSNIDVSDAGAVQLLLKIVSKKYQSIDCLINNAAIQAEKSLIETTEEEWDRVFRVNLYSVFYLVKYFIELLNNSALINMSSVHAKATSQGLAAYAASKGAISSLTRAMALELADRGIRVNAILPGAIDTPMLQKGLQRNKSAKEAEKNIIEATPLHKIGKPEDVADLALFLADSSKSGNITGQEFVCDGGVLAKLASE